MHPSSAYLHTLFALSTLREFYIRNRIYMRTDLIGHSFLLLFVQHSMYKGNRDRPFADC